MGIWQHLKHAYATGQLVTPQRQDANQPPEETVAQRLAQRYAQRLQREAARVEETTLWHAWMTTAQSWAAARVAATDVQAPTVVGDGDTRMQEIRDALAAYAQTWQAQTTQNIPTRITEQELTRQWYGHDQGPYRHSRTDDTPEPPRQRIGY